MSVSKAAPSRPNRAPIVFAAALVLMCVIWFLGFAVRISLNQDTDIVARAGISRVLNGGFSDFRETTFLILVAVSCYVLCLLALRRRFRHDFAAAIGGTVLAATLSRRTCWARR